MTSAHLTPAKQALHPAAPTFTARVVNLSCRAWRSYWRWRARQATILILRSLDARTLHDIGIDPSEIQSVVWSRRGDRRRVYDEDWLERQEVDRLKLPAVALGSPRGN